MLKTHRLRSLLRCNGVLAGQDSRLSWTFWRHKCSCLTLENTFKCYDLETGPPMDVELSRDDALVMYTQMLESRRFEMMADTYYKQRLIRGFCHLYIGQEAVAVGMKSCFRKQDSLITAYRCHAWTYLMGVPLYEIMAELLGFRTGTTRGKGGSMHMFTEHFYGGNGIVGAQVPIGTGVGLAHSYRNDGGVCFTLYGDGAANQGQVFESYNMAKLWCLPVVFVCENNHYGMGTKTSRASAMTDFYMRGQYIPGLWVDGNQVLAVRSATQFAVDYASKHGPIVLEMSTYRYVGHSMSDPGTSYRSREEIQSVRESRDPITSFRQQILDLCLACEEELKALDDKTKKYVDGECSRALKDKEVDLEELYSDVYAKNLEPKIRSVSFYNLDHIKLSDVCIGKPKRTPACEINEPEPEPKPKEKAKAQEKGKPGKDGKPADTKPKADTKTDKPSSGDNKAKAETKDEPKNQENSPKPPTETKDDPKKLENPPKPPTDKANPAGKPPAGDVPAPTSPKTAQKK